MQLLPLNNSDLNSPPLFDSFSNLIFLTAGLKLTISNGSSLTQVPFSKEDRIQSYQSFVNHIMIRFTILPLKQSNNLEANLLVNSVFSFPLQ